MTKNDQAQNTAEVPKEIGAKFLKAAKDCSPIRLNQILLDHKDKPYFEQLINLRTEDEVNALGCILLSSKKTQHIEAAKLLVLNPAFHINEYLLKGQHQNVTDPDAQGGWNALHWSIVYNKPQLLALLKERNSKLNEDDHDAYVNFSYPVANPKQHWFSPEKLIETYGRDMDLSANTRAYPDDWSESSGDSDIEGSHAHKYKVQQYKAAGASQVKERETDSFKTPKKQNPKKAPIQARKPTDDENEMIALLSSAQTDQATVEQIENALNFAKEISIAHYHGMPILDGTVSSKQKFDLYQKIMKTNDADRANFAHMLLSRTLTTSAGVENVRMLLEHGDDFMAKIEDADKALKTIFAKMCEVDHKRFDLLISKFVNASTNSRDSDNKHHTEFWTLIKAFCESDAMKETLEPLLELVVQYRFPFLSTSKAPDHAIKYGFGIHVEELRGEKRLDPQYDEHGYPKHRLAGFVFVIRHDLPDYMKEGELHNDLTHYHKLHQMRGISDGKPKAMNREMLPQLEVTFSASIDTQNIVAVIPLLYPNFSKDFDQSYHGDVLGYDERTYKLDKENAISNNIDDLHGIINSVAHFAYRSAAIQLGGSEKILCNMTPGNGLESLEANGMLDFKMMASKKSSPSQTNLLEAAKNIGAAFNMNPLLDSLRKIDSQKNGDDFSDLHYEQNAGKPGLSGLDSGAGSDSE